MIERPTPERPLSHLLADELCRVAAELEERYRTFKINSVGEAIDYVRRCAHSKLAGSDEKAT